MVALLIAFLLVAPADPAPASRDGIVLTVPYLPQTEALCGGAAAAMVFRFLGDRHASVEQFSDLMDRRAGGIAQGVLLDAIRRRGWQATAERGTLDRLEQRLRAHAPPILLLEDRPGRYHYVVATGIDAVSVFIHDPAVGPSRRMPREQLLERWKATDFWLALIERPVQPTTVETTQAENPPARDVAPGRSKDRPLRTSVPNPESPVPSPQSRVSSPQSPVPSPSRRDRCGMLLDAALDAIEANGLGSAEASLADVRQQCPDDARPIRELAGVRFAERRWSDAAELAAEAARLDSTDHYTWELLGASRLVANDTSGALAAWNQIGRPLVDRIQIDGVQRARYSMLADAIGLTPDTVLTPRDLQMARRRLEQLPDRAASRLSVTPDSDGYAVVNAVLIERQRAPVGAEWVAAAVQTATEREVAVTVPGFTGQGEVWRGSWRWWERRPRIRFGIEAPVRRGIRGVWGAEFSRESQAYRSAGPGVFEETRARGRITFANWLTPTLRYSVAAGLESWMDAGRSTTFEASFERRSTGDRLSLGQSVEAGRGFGGAPAYAAGRTTVRARTSAEASGFVGLLAADLSMASGDAPLALWQGAGEGRARPGLLRAHRLLHEGIIDGSVFGRRIATATVEARRWFSGAVSAPFGIAGFVDIASAADRLPGAIGSPTRIDAGAGIRARLPGRDGTLRVDYARGLSDGASTVVVGWSIW